MGIKPAAYQLSGKGHAKGAARVSRGLHYTVTWPRSLPSAPPRELRSSLQAEINPASAFRPYPSCPLNIRWGPPSAEPTAPARAIEIVVQVPARRCPTLRAAKFKSDRLGFERGFCDFLRGTPLLLRNRDSVSQIISLAAKRHVSISAPVVLRTARRPCSDPASTDATGPNRQRRGRRPRPAGSKNRRTTAADKDGGPRTRIVPSLYVNACALCG
jgi:hypothetical protein